MKRSPATLYLNIIIITMITVRKYEFIDISKTALVYSLLVSIIIVIE